MYVHVLVCLGEVWGIIHQKPWGLTTQTREERSRDAETARATAGILRSALAGLTEYSTKIEVCNNFRLPIKNTKGSLISASDEFC